MAANPEVNTLKAKRAGAAAQAADAIAERTPSLADRPPMVGEAVSRRFPLLGDPGEPRVVAESSGALFGVMPGQEIRGYVIATEDAYETIIPPGCKTGTSRLRWARGHHVPTEVYERWQASRATPSGAAD